MPKTFLRIFLLLLSLSALLPTPAARAQCATVPALPLPFQAFDVQTGQLVQAFCVGREVRFELSQGRVVNQSIPTFFVVQPGTGVLPPGCNFNLPGQPTNRYTPTAAGPVTVAENSNVGSGATAQSVVYFRNFTVLASPPPTFTLIPCATNTALVTITDTNYDTYSLRVAGGGPDLPLSWGQTTTVPAGTGSFTLTGRYALGGLCEGRSTQALAPLLAPLPPALSSLTLAGPLPGPLTLTVGQLTPGYLYTLQAADAGAPGGYRDLLAVPAASPATTLTLPSAAASCYRLRRRDACGTAEAVTPDLCTLELSATPGNARNLLSFRTATTGALRYDLSRAIGTGAPQLLRSFASLPAAFEDAAVVCGTRYTYRLTAVLPGGQTSVSNEASVTSQSALAPPTPRLAASFDLRNRVVLTASLPGGQPVSAGARLRYLRTLGGSARELGQAPAGAVFRDSTALDSLLARPPCYSVRLTDLCGNAAAQASAPACPALLTAEAVADSPGSLPTDPAVRLRWTAPTGPDAGPAPSYRLLLLDAAGIVLRALPVAGNAYLDPSPPPENQLLRYRLEVSGLGLGVPAYSNLALVARAVRVAVPTAFTPNGDGLNDVLEVKGRFLRDFSFTVFDRNGQEVFRATERRQTWDGRIKGRPPVNGAYVWRLRLSDEAGRAVQQTGTVSILQ